MSQLGASSEVLLEAANVLWPDGSLAPGWVRVGRKGILDAGRGAAPGAPDLTGWVLAPGFVDVHCHGGGTRTFCTTDAEEARAAAALHAAHGTSTVVASLVSAGAETLLEQVAVLAGLADDGAIAGIHLEGPWLSPLHRGAHDPAALRAPDPREVDALLRAGRGHVRMVTVAPEIPGGLELIRRLVADGVVVALGHTDADADGLRAGADAGATVVTHLCNAMRPIHHRDPGPVVAALQDERLAVELIADGTHVHPDVLRLLLGAAGERALLVTDAMAAAGAPDGRYLLGSLEVDVVDGVARLHGPDGRPGSIAGSTLTMDRAVRGAVAAGADLGGALRAATAAPAAALGLRGGRLEVGAEAHLILLDEGLAVREVVRGA